ncbi:hypothetical protein J5N97_005688 [Dioscorea zingiberensis]|uniref:RWP-RK domain-containing protein n=1 Tax=Dioscorea zingiberensis TaxID=325984 RepID=A0A9D5HT99_9LILI|nr:hypothetical protein J5N97_005688 [Dioscorea zingiberensis]
MDAYDHGSEKIDQIVSFSEDDELLRYLNFSEPDHVSLSLQQETGNHGDQFSNNPVNISNTSHDLVDLDEVTIRKTSDDDMVVDCYCGNENFGKVLNGEPVINYLPWINGDNGEQRGSFDQPEIGQQLGFRDGHISFSNRECITSSGLEKAHEFIINQEWIPIGLDATILGKDAGGVLESESVPQMGIGDEVIHETTPFNNSDLTLTTLPMNLLDCSGCLVLRETVHQNELLTIKVTIHGGIGTFKHAIFKLEYHIEEIDSSADEFFIDFVGKSDEWIKEFLLQHNLSSANKGFTIQYDSLSSFYDALCAGMNTMNNGAQFPHQWPALIESIGPSVTTPQAHAAQVPTNTSSIGSSSCTPKHDSPGPVTKPTRSKNQRQNEWPSLLEQRERTKQLDMSEVGNFFNIPIVEAAKKLQICSTALKHICRRHGVKRWPFRKVQSKEKAISNLENELKNKSGEEAEKIQKQINKLRTAIERIREGKTP